MSKPKTNVKVRLTRRIFIKMDISYSLLETTLAMFDALNYLPNFKKFGIDGTVLPFLTDEDLQIIGIDDKELRNKLIRQCKRLPTNSESRLNLSVNEKYLMTVLEEIDKHLLTLEASVSYAVKRKNIQPCDIKLYRAAKCLNNCINSMQKEFRNFYYMFAPKPTKKLSKWKVSILVLISATATCLVLKRFISL